MDPVELLDILGNENRRRILQLLSFRPFYFNEIAKRLDVGPKAVIDHLEMLKRSGLIECYPDTKRRKYFRIARKIVLEVAVSPHTYGIRTFRSEIASSSGVYYYREMGETIPDMAQLKKELYILEERRRDLRKLMDEVESKEMDLKMIAAGAIHGNTQNQLEAEIMVALLSGNSLVSDLAMKLEVPELIVEDLLKRLEERGAVQCRGEIWGI
ncbi:MAG: ArsR family transcriptional regulator [Methanotrichaceae archaeon]|nr:ArsR family transcriptional regulator [Methanotrichaceae archaeon]